MSAAVDTLAVFRRVPKGLCTLRCRNHVKPFKYICDPRLKGVPNVPIVINYKCMRAGREDNTDARM